MACLWPEVQDLIAVMRSHSPFAADIKVRHSPPLLPSIHPPTFPRQSSVLVKLPYLCCVLQEVAHASLAEVETVVGRALRAPQLRHPVEAGSGSGASGIGTNGSDVPLGLTGLQGEAWLDDGLLGLLCGVSVDHMMFWALNT